MDNLLARAGRRVRRHVGPVRWGRDLAHLHNTSTGVLRCAYDRHMTTKLMGYVDGAGLGADGEGIVNPIAVSWKADKKGVGDAEGARPSF